MVMKRGCGTVQHPTTIPSDRTFFHRYAAFDHRGCFLKSGVLGVFCSLVAGSYLVLLSSKNLRVWLLPRRELRR